MAEDMEFESDGKNMSPSEEAMIGMRRIAGNQILRKVSMQGGDAWVQVKPPVDDSVDGAEKPVWNGARFTSSMNHIQIH